MAALVVRHEHADEGRHGHRRSPPHAEGLRQRLVPVVSGIAAPRPVGRVSNVDQRARDAELDELNAADQVRRDYQRDYDEALELADDADVAYGDGTAGSVRLLRDPYDVLVERAAGAPATAADDGDGWGS